MTPAAKTCGPVLCWSLAEIVKILNNGNIRGVPVLRTMVSNTREYNPKAFQVFGPKIVRPGANTTIPLLRADF